MSMISVRVNTTELHSDEILFRMYISSSTKQAVWVHNLFKHMSICNTINMAINDIINMTSKPMCTKESITT